jgi:hypothetical protein
MTFFQFGAQCKATKSVAARVKNLMEEAPDVTFEGLVKVIGEHFVRDDSNKVSGNELAKTLICKSF